MYATFAFVLQKVPKNRRVYAFQVSTADFDSLAATEQPNSAKLLQSYGVGGEERYVRMYVSLLFHLVMCLAKKSV